MSSDMADIPPKKQSLSATFLMLAIAFIVRVDEVPSSKVMIIIVEPLSEYNIFCKLSGMASFGIVISKTSSRQYTFFTPSIFLISFFNLTTSRSFMPLTTSSSTLARSKSSPRIFCACMDSTSLGKYDNKS